MLLHFAKKLERVRQKITAHMVNSAISDGMSRGQAVAHVAEFKSRQIDKRQKLKPALCFAFGIALAVGAMVGIKLL